MVSGKRALEFLAGGMVMYAILFLINQEKSPVSPFIPEPVSRALDMTVGQVAKYTARGLRNNNPGNIRYNPANEWVGQTGSDGTYSIFDEMENGIRAMAKILQSYRRRGQTSIRAIISNWAPATENNTLAYMNAVARAMGRTIDEPLGADAPTQIALMMAITRHENGMNPISSETFAEGLRRAG